MPLPPSSFRRKVRKKAVSRSFRVPAAVDRLLDREAAKKGWTKSFLIREILISWFNFNEAKEKIEP